MLDWRYRSWKRATELADAYLRSPIQWVAPRSNLGLNSFTDGLLKYGTCLKKRRGRVTEVDGDNWCAQSGRLGKCDFFSEVDEILKRMDDRTADESFVDFLKHCCRQSKTNRRLQEAKERALSYVTGFNAADPSQVKNGADERT